MSDNRLCRGRAAWSGQHFAARHTASPWTIDLFFLIFVSSFGISRLNFPVRVRDDLRPFCRPPLLLLGILLVIFTIDVLVDEPLYVFGSWLSK